MQTPAMLLLPVTSLATFDFVVQRVRMERQTAATSPLIAVMLASTIIGFGYNVQINPVEGAFDVHITKGWSQSLFLIVVGE